MSRLRLALAGTSRLEAVAGEWEALGAAGGAELSSELLAALAEGGATEQELVAAAANAGGYPAVEHLYRLLFALHEECLLARRAVDDAGEAPARILASCLPLVAACPFSTAVPGARRFALSRFALLRRRREELVLESPRSLARLHCHDRRVAALLARLARPASLAELAAEGDLGLAPEALAALIELMAFGAFLAVADPDPAPGPDGTVSASSFAEQRGALGQWQFHDLLFHSRSRSGRFDGGYGATFRLRGKTAPLPALKPRMAGATVALPRPELAAGRPSTASLAWAIEHRRSRRDHSGPPIALPELAELLYRTARAAAPEAGLAYEVARRPYPGGGAAWELEPYLVVDRCRGLPPGLYHYRAGGHELTRLAGPTPESDRLLVSAGRAAGLAAGVAAGLELHQVRPQVLVIFGARFGRLFWKYSAMAYATVLKDVGVLLQSLYLTATAMDLSACAIGGGDAELFAAATGLDPAEESSVGEMIVGRASAATVTGAGWRSRAR
jgi:SagB-type dehydrogenase family enzyme